MDQTWERIAKRQIGETASANEPMPGMQGKSFGERESHSAWGVDLCEKKLPILSGNIGVCFNKYIPLFMRLPFLS